MKPPKLIVKSLGFIKTVSGLTRVGEAIDDLLTGHSNISAQLASDPNGANIVPANVAQVSAQHLGNGLVDVALTDNSEVSRAISYFVDVDSSPNFTANPRTYTNGPVRNISMTLPNGTWYLQGYSQYQHGGPPSTPVRFPQPIVVSGSASLPLLPAQGGGTGAAGRAGQGAGPTVSR